MFRQSIEFVYGIDCNYIEDDGQIGINNQIRKDLYFMNSPLIYIQIHRNKTNREEINKS